MSNSVIFLVLFFLLLHIPPHVFPSPQSSSFPFQCASVISLLAAVDLQPAHHSHSGLQGRKWTSGALICYLYYRKRVALRLNLRAWWSIHIHIKTSDVPPYSEIGFTVSAGGNHCQITLLTEHCLATQEGWWGYLISIRYLKFRVLRVLKMYRLLSGWWLHFDRKVRLKSNTSTFFACKSSGIEKSRLKSDLCGYSYRESLKMSTRICSGFLLASAVTLITGLRCEVEQSSTHFLCPGGWSESLWHLPASVGLAGSRWS